VGSPEVDRVTQRPARTRDPVLPQTGASAYRLGGWPAGASWRSRVLHTCEHASSCPLSLSVFECAAGAVAGAGVAGAICMSACQHARAQMHARVSRRLVRPLTRFGTPQEHLKVLEQGSVWFRDRLMTRPTGPLPPLAARITPTLFALSILWLCYAFPGMHACWYVKLTEGGVCAYTHGVHTLQGATRQIRPRWS
jgi:hypothetical protein